MSGVTPLLLIFLYDFYRENLSLSLPQNAHFVYIYTGVPLATEPGISLIILPLMRTLQRNLKRA
jgi:hypothetical protein